MLENEGVFEIQPKIPAFFKEELDEEQYESVIKSNGKSLIIAGPGSGKTRVITYKIAYLIYNDIKPENILLLTFTRAAAKQMIERVKNVTNMELNGMMAGTFHHFCNYILRVYASKIGFNNNFTILDSEDSKDLMKIARNEYCEKLGDYAKKIPKENVILKIISYSSNTLKSLRESILEISSFLIEYENDIEQIWIKYQELKKEINAMDYDDLLINTAMLLKSDKELLKYISKRYRYVLVDEFQDTNKIQLEIVEALSDYHKNLIAVGDDSQSIYSFRGARFENIKDFMDEKNVKLFKIQTNYRSTPEIVNLINDMIPTSSVKKHLNAKRKPYLKPTIIETFDDLEQSEAVIKIIDEKIEEGIEYNDIAILYRSHALSMSLQQKLDSKLIPYKLLSGKRFIETRHIKDILSFLKILYNPYDKISWIRVMKLFPGIGTKTAVRNYESIISNLSEGINILDIFDKLSNKKTKDIYELLTKIYKKRDDKPQNLINEIYENFYKEYSNLNYKNSRSRNMDIERFSEISSKYENTGKFLEDMTLSENIEVRPSDKNDKKDEITLTTVHGSKGLEWKVVIIISANPGDFPNGMAIKEKNLDEEERLFYVAITRAKDELYILKQTTGSTNPYLRNSFVFIKSENDFIKKISEDKVNKMRVGYL
ncbi:ATP-dependent helicase [Oceanotoga sp. DSM 15011]|jgi:DNA helicase-2/ATP-dependent DNA helicase PcrA|uniref:DNA 3'-5' helicase n=1 Tax=Oceanotoga teriensis TaxID=515440 RepID=A0AA45C653_9BACT|nr:MULTISPECIES: ATP-dependent helicase [Oceanotoga]MDN5343361.1 ATP-dependent helicase UvrD/PcrA [Oceanotoga sp.]MDO7975654.1 ATP-dependent helicase [Oceanotoga teriensis]PWJ90597.1 DNA helicase-2/ATP-dependent DNA helicase PcrA [Oceanotoga teriensis]UYO99842.1 ATP-dependent helicase [Oceanotoga sp. DSM 15011]